jgi:hypothetical protein
MHCYVGTKSILGSGDDIMEFDSNLERNEGELTSRVEQQTSKIPSMVYLGLAVGSMALSAILKMKRRDSWALFIGQWAAPFLIMGNYNKMVKHHGSDSRSDFRQAA